jgi:alpha-galactosidase
MDVADSLVRTGLRDAGYRFINLDAGVWLPNRTADGHIQADPSKFPSGMKKLAEYVHDHGLGLGLYTDLSNRSVGKVCGTGPGSFGHFEADMQTFADIGFDYLKVDYCAYDWAGSHVPSIEDSYQYWSEIRDAVNKTDRPVYLYSCPRSWSNKTAGQVRDGPPQEWSAKKRRGLANALLTEDRNSHDSWESVLKNLDAVTTLTNLSYAEPGFWQDADLLHSCEFGKGKVSGDGMTVAEYTANYATWAILASQMILSSDLRTIDSSPTGQYADCLRMLTNKEILAVNQDIAGE